MNDWVFDLQRFAEGEAAQDAPADTPAYEAQQGAQESPATSAGTPPAVETATEGVAIRIDPATGARTVVNIGAEQQTAPPAEEHAGENAEHPDTPPQPAPYTAEELLASMTTGRTDETRIPEELRAPYIAIRQQQQIAALTAQQQMQQSAPPVQQAQETVQDAEIYRRIQEAAEQKAQQELGITPEQLSGMSYSDDPNETKKAEEYRIAVQMNVNAIAREIDAYQSNLAQQQAEAQAFAAEFLPKMQQAQAKEPNFNQIDVMMESYYVAPRTGRRCGAAIPKRHVYACGCPCARRVLREDAGGVLCQKDGAHTDPTACAESRPSIGGRSGTCRAVCAAADGLECYALDGCAGA